MTLANHGFQTECMMLALNGVLGRNQGICDLTGEAFWIVHIVFTLIWINLQTHIEWLLLLLYNSSSFFQTPENPQPVKNC